MELKINGEDINLRKLKRADAVALFENVNDFEVFQYTTVPYAYKLSEVKNFIAKTHRNLKNKKAIELGIELKEIGGIVGMICLKNLDMKNQSAEITYWLGKKYWGKKIMKEAVRLILEFGFEKLQLVRIYARVMHPNVSSAKLLEKSGFRYEGTLRKTTYQNRQWLDNLRYSILNTEFKSEK